MAIPRDYEIKDAFRFAIKRDYTGRYTVTKLDFCSELKRLNLHYTPPQANNWIQAHR